MTDVMVSVRLPGKLYEAVLANALASDVSVSEWVREALEESMNRRCGA